MDKFLADAATAYWWITAVAVGLVINLASAYIKEPIDRFFAATSRGWRARSEKARAERQAHVLQLARDPSLWAPLREMARDLRINAIWNAARAAIVLLMIVLGFEATNYNPTNPIAQHHAWVIALLFVVTFLLFFVLLTSAQSLYGRADELIRRLREAKGAADLL